LLNALELGIVQRLGSHQPNEIDTRIIASSSGDLEAQVKEGAFRSDLYYRLSPFEITLPPLRDRLSDLPNLVENYLERINRFQPHPIRVVPQTLELMANYRWPGNIRELEGSLETRHCPLRWRAVYLPGTSTRIYSPGEHTRAARRTGRFPGRARTRHYFERSPHLPGQHDSNGSNAGHRSYHHMAAFEAIGYRHRPISG
jgi:hypothetical protein